MKRVGFRKSILAIALSMLMVVLSVPVNGMRVQAVDCPHCGGNGYVCSDHNSWVHDGYGYAEVDDCGLPCDISKEGGCYIHWGDNLVKCEYCCNHSYVYVHQTDENGENYHIRLCLICNSKPDDNNGSCNTRGRDGACSYCGYNALHTHVKGTHHAEVAATCTEAGTIEYWDCTCGAMLNASGEEISSIIGEPFKGHRYENWEDGVSECTGTGCTAFVTCTHNGATTGTCSICGKELSSPISIKEPRYVYGDATNGISEWEDVTLDDTPIISITSSDTTLGISGETIWYIVDSADLTISGTVTVYGEVYIILADGAKLTVNGIDQNAGIHVTDGGCLGIYGQNEGTGQLIVNGGANGAGSDITINGGTVTATGGANAAGIGGSNGGGSKITINGGTVTAAGGANAAGIGGGNNGDGTNINISGGHTIAIGGTNGAGIGGGSGGDGKKILINGEIIEAIGGTNAVGIGGGAGGELSEITIALALYVYAGADKSLATDISIKLPNYADELADKAYVGIYAYENSLFSYMYPVYNTENTPSSGIKEWKLGVTCYSPITTSDTILGVSGKTTWYVVDSADLTISETVTVQGNVNIILADGAKLTVNGTKYRAGINVSGIGNSLTVYGQTEGSGQLIVTGGRRGAGIGGDNDQSGSNITICGGRVTAEGGEDGAGIGGGSTGTGSNITINGGSVAATGGSGADGIGGGGFNNGSDITINGGSIEATGCGGGVGIGGGAGGVRGITIASGLVVNAGSDKASADAVTSGGSTWAARLSDKEYVCIAAEGSPITLKYGSLLIGSSVIGYKIYMDIPEEYYNADSYMLIDGVEKVKLSDARIDSDDIYYLTVFFEPKYYDVKKVVQFYDGDNNIISLKSSSGRAMTGNCYSFCVKDLFDEINADSSSYSEETLTEVKLMNNICVAAKNYFLGTDIAIEQNCDVSYDVLDEYKLQFKTINNGGVVDGWNLTEFTYMGASLIINGQITIRHYFLVDSQVDISNFDFTCEGLEIKPVLVDKCDNLMYLDYPLDSYAGLHCMFHFEIERQDRSEKVDFYYGVYNYAYQVLSVQPTGKLADLVIALYRYGEWRD